MTRLILSGCNGKMGRVITSCVESRCDCTIVAGFDINTESHAGYPVYANPANCNAEADVLIDFSHPSALAGVLAYAQEHRIPAVIATTGLSNEQVEEIKTAASVIPVFFSANMSLGINLLRNWFVKPPLFWATISILKFWKSIIIRSWTLLPVRP